MRATSCCGSLIGTKNQRIKPTTMSCTECQMPIYAVNAQNVTTAFRQVAHDEVNDEVADLTALPNVKLGLTNAGTTYSEVAAFAHLPLDFARLLYLVKCLEEIRQDGIICAKLISKPV